MIDHDKKLHFEYTKEYTFRPDIPEGLTRRLAVVNQIFFFAKYF